MRRLNLHQIPLTEEYTYLVDSDDALRAWANNEGDNFTHVHIAAGTYTMYTQLEGGTADNPLAAIDLTNTQTRRVTGAAGSKLFFINTIRGFFAALRGRLPVIARISHGTATIAETILYQASLSRHEMSLSRTTTQSRSTAARI